MSDSPPISESIAAALRITGSALAADAPNLSTMRFALRNAQMTLGAAAHENQRLTEENASLKAAQSLRTNPTPGSQSLDPLEAHGKVIIAFAKRFTVYHGLWIYKESIGIPCPIVDLNEQPDDKYKTPEARVKHMATMLYNELPPIEDLRKCLEKMPAFAKMILKQSSQGRSAMVSTVQANVGIIFNSYEGIDFNAWTQNRSSRDMTMFRRLLSFEPDPSQDKSDSPLKADVHPPLIYPGLLKRKSGAFRNVALFKIARVLLFGNSSISNTGTIFPGSNGFSWGRQSNLLGLISLTVTLAVFIVAGDKSFGVTGAVSKITYQADYVARKRALEKLRVQSPRQYLDLMECWAREVYAGLPTDDDDDESPFDSAPTDSQDTETLEDLGPSDSESDDENPIALTISGSVPSSPVPTLPPTPIPQRTGALARNEPLLYPDLDDSITSTRSSHLSREPTLRAFAPAQSPSLSILSASAPIISDIIDLGARNDDDIAEFAIIDPPTNEGSASGRGRVAGARGRRNAIAEPTRPTRNSTRTRNATARS